MFETIISMKVHAFLKIIGFKIVKINVYLYDGVICLSHR